MKYTPSFSAIAMGLFAATLSHSAITFTGENAIYPNSQEENHWSAISIGSSNYIPFGQVDIAGPEIVYINDLNVGAAPNTNANFNLDGQGAVCLVNNLIAGGYAESTSNLKITNGALLSTSPGSSTFIGEKSSARINVQVDNGSTLDFGGSLFLRSSYINFNVTNDSLLRMNGDWVVGSVDAGGQQDVVVDDSAVFANEFTVNEHGSFHASDSTLNLASFQILNEVELVNTQVNFKIIMRNDDFLTLNDCVINANEGYANIFTNYGIINASGTVNVGSFNNEEEAELRVLSNEKLKVNGEFLNEGRVEVIDSELEVYNEMPFIGIENLDHDSSLLISDGIVRANVTNNTGEILFSSGQSMYFGHIQNYNKIIVSGQANVTFWDSIQQDHILKVAADSVATFFGNYYGEPISGFGTAYLEGQTDPGHSPGNGVNSTNTYLGLDHVLTIELGGLTPITEHDIFGSLQTLGLDGDLKVVWYDNFQASLGDTFDILEWNTLLGSFKNIDFSGAPLAGNLEWDTSNLYIDGTITVIPEPATFSCLAFTFLALTTRRRSA